MKCPKNLLGLHLDRNLSAKDSQLVEDHLTRCPDCRQEYIQLQKMFELLQAVPVPETEVSFVDSVMQALEHEPIPIAREAQRRSLLARYIGWASSLFGLFSFGLIVYFLRGSLYDLIWNEVVWVWGQVVVLGTNLAPSPFALVNSVHGVKSWLLVIDSLWQNSYMWAATVVLGLCAWTIVREIVVDLQKVLGYNR